MVALLLENGADKDREVMGWTALAMAEHLGHEEVAALLREHGAT